MESVINSKPLSDAQLMVLQIVKNQYSEQDLNELRELLLDFNNRKMQAHLDEIVAEKGYSDKDFNNMLHAHSRKTR